jgi:glycerol-3-phosphate dehydrogenase
VTLLSVVDERVMFVLPTGRSTIIGTTETEAPADPDSVRASTADIDYLLASANAVFPAARLEPSDVVAAWAGIRPLAASGQPVDAASASREYEIARAPSGMLTVTGGKLTTYRAMAADVVDTLMGELDRPFVPTTTHLVPLPGGDRRAAVDALAASDPKLASPLERDLPYRVADVVYAVRHEYAVTLSDLLMRRTHLAFETRDAAVGLAPRVAQVVAALLGWDGAAQTAAVDAYAADAKRVFGIDGRGR